MAILGALLVLLVMRRHNTRRVQRTSQRGFLTASAAVIEFLVFLTGFALVALGVLSHLSL